MSQSDAIIDSMPLLEMDQQELEFCQEEAFAYFDSLSNESLGVWIDESNEWDGEEAPF